ncbi:MAG: hypothetical protein ACR2QK_24565, partial [Acidimicrobiales bacterium]
IYGHVNNAAYWTAAEHWLVEPMVSGSMRARLEYGSGLEPVDSVEIARSSGPFGLRLWWLEPGAEAGRSALTTAAVAASLSVRPLPDGLYRQT